MSQPDNSTTGWHSDDEYEFPEGIDWSTVGPIESDEQNLAGVQTQPPPPSEPPQRPGSSSSSYGFTDLETLNEDDLAELDETERLYGLIAEGHLENTAPNSSQTLGTISRPIARLPTADDLVHLSSQSSTSHKRKPSSEDAKSSLLKKAKTLPLECTKSSSKGKEVAQSIQIEDVVQAVYDSFVESCSCPICYDLFAVPHNIMPCGHTVCGACLCNWVDRSQPNPSCPICRQALDNKTSLSRNYVVESVMDQQARILTTHGYPGWEPLGADVIAWTERKTSFQREAPVRLARVTAQLRVTPSTLPTPPANNSRRRHTNRGRDRDQVIEIRAFEVVRTRP